MKMESVAIATATSQCAPPASESQRRTKQALEGPRAVSEEEMFRDGLQLPVCRGQLVTPSVFASVFFTFEKQRNSAGTGRGLRVRGGRAELGGWTPCEGAEPERAARPPPLWGEGSRGAAQRTL